jgi:hypothetical protein
VDGGTADRAPTSDDATPSPVTDSGGPKPDAANPIEDAGSDADADAAPETGTTLDGGTCDGGVVGVVSATPTFAYDGQKTSITVTGSGFVSTPRVYLRGSGGALTQLSGAAFVSDTSISATIPANLADDTYDLVVVNPDGCAGALAGFKVVGNPVPLVLSVSPASGTSQADTPVVVTGCNFANNATLSTVNESGTVLAQTANAPVAGAADARCGGSPLYTMTGSILTKADAAQLTPGAYLIRVGNPTDGTYGDWSAFVVTNPSGNLSAWEKASSLSTGRRSLGLLAGRVDDANRFLYAIGGEDASGTALDSIEIAPIDRFGQVGKWFKSKRSLGVPRSGLTVIRQGQYLYAIGGTSSANGTAGANATNPSGTPLATIERAKILDPAGAPKFGDPAPVTGTGTLAAGTYYYKVAAILNGSNAATEGETLPSDEVSAVLTADGEVQLKWTAPSVGTVTGYRIYRTKDPDGASGDEVLLKDNVSGTTFIDTGAETAGTEVPLALGSTGPWKDAGKSLNHARLDTASTIAPDPTGAARYVYVLGGWGQCLATTGVMNCYEYATISDDGATLGNFVAVAGGPAHARMRHGFTTMTAENGPANFVAKAGANTAFVVVSGGKGINTTANTVEYALVGTAGLLGSFANPSSGFSSERDGTQLLIANGYGYAFQGGAAAAYSNAQTSDQSALSTVTSTTLSFPNWSNAGANLTFKLARHAATTESAFFYIVGGTTNDTDALSSVYRILH